MINSTTDRAADAKQLVDLNNRIQAFQQLGETELVFVGTQFFKAASAFPEFTNRALYYSNLAKSGSVAAVEQALFNLVGLYLDTVDKEHIERLTGVHLGGDPTLYLKYFVMDEAEKIKYDRAVELLRDDTNYWWLSDLAYNLARKTSGGEAVSLTTAHDVWRQWKSITAFLVDFPFKAGFTPTKEQQSIMSTYRGNYEMLKLTLATNSISLNVLAFEIVLYAASCQDIDFMLAWQARTWTLMLQQFTLDEIKHACAAVTAILTANVDRIRGELKLVLLPLESKAIWKHQEYILPMGNKDMKLLCDVYEHQPDVRKYSELAEAIDVRDDHALIQQIKHQILTTLLTAGFNSADAVAIRDMVVAVPKVGFRFQQNNS